MLSVFCGGFRKDQDVIQIDKDKDKQIQIISQDVIDEGLKGSICEAEWHDQALEVT